VELLGPVDGVWFLSSHSERPILIACEMAARLPALVAVLKQHGVEGVEVLSAYREEPFTSFHTMGMALDINRLYRGRGWLSVQSHYEATPDQRTCSGPQPAGGAARVLRRIACDLYRSGKFQSGADAQLQRGPPRPLPHRHPARRPARVPALRERREAATTAEPRRSVCGPAVPERESGRSARQPGRGPSRRWVRRRPH
jgi:hypothetical protein